jgi:hypothetical protein
LWTAAVGSVDIRYSGDGDDACVGIVGQNCSFKPIIEIGRIYHDDTISGNIRITRSDIK